MAIGSTIIIGAGEVGYALFKVLERLPNHVLRVRDIGDESTKKTLHFDVMHICFPYSKTFVRAVRTYQKQYTPKYTVIHSTVPVGTSRKCSAFHSPVRGVHPNLQSGIMTFEKWLGPESNDLAAYFECAGIPVMQCANPETTELAKILCTTYYGWNIVFEKEVFKLCKKHKVPFADVYTKWNEQYNRGYTRLGMSHVVRPVLKHVPGKIGGHCVLNNLKFLKSKVAKFIKDYKE